MSSHKTVLKMEGIHAAFRLSITAGLFLFFAGSAYAQLGSASINGTIRDTSGAVIPATQVVLQNANTGVRTTTTSNNSGVYVFVHGGRPSARPGLTGRPIQKVKTRRGKFGRRSRK
jgi:hypothetical protein